MSLLHTVGGGADDKLYYAYALINPETLKPFYIGKGSTDRAESHYKLVNINRETNKAKKELMLRLNGQPPIIVKSELMDEEDAFEIEMLLIAEYGRQSNGSGILTNITSGGTGLGGENNPMFGRVGGMAGKKHTKESLAKMSESQKGRILTDEHKANMRKPKSEVGRLAIAEAQRKLKESGYRPSEESNAKRSTTLLGRVITDEHANKIAEALRGKAKAKVTCPHCLKVGGAGLMQRWHFDNCKLKQEEVV